jgi:hypothetical protein
MNNYGFSNENSRDNNKNDLPPAYGNAVNPSKINTFYLINFLF